MKSVHTDIKKRGRGGFTLVEVIVTLVILALIAAVIVPALTGWIDHSREKICQIHRYEIIRWYRTEQQLHYADGVSVTLADVLAGNVPETASDVPAATCPSGGTYTASGESIACSVHGGLTDGEGGEGGDEGGGSATPAPNVLPGTSIPVVGSYWPTQEEYADNPYGNRTVTAGGVFQYSDGSYYVVTKTQSITKGQAATGPGGDLLGWYSTEKITGRIVTASDFNAWGGTTQINNITRGDIYSDGAGHYYVFNSGGSVASLPSVSMAGWYLLP